MKNSNISAFIITLLIGIAIGSVGVGIWFDRNRVVSLPIDSTSTPVVITESNYFTNVDQWQLYRNATIKFSMAFPVDFPSDEIHTTKTAKDWRLNTQDVGSKILSVTIPRVFEAQSNFLDATVTVGKSNVARAVATCLLSDENSNTMASTTVMIHGVPFIAFTSTDAGAGNIYETTSYRAVRGGECYAIETTIHSTHVENYPAEYNLHEFNKTRVQSVLKTIVSTFTFL